MKKYIIRNLLGKVQALTSRGCSSFKKRKNHTTSYYLCEDLIDEIIGRLPPKSLLRFRSLSKSWCSRITSPSFIRMNALRSAKTPTKVITRQRIHYKLIHSQLNYGVNVSYTVHPEESYTGIKDVNFPCSNFHVCGSCNGIICLYDKKPKRTMILWNPSIGRKLTVPKHHYGSLIYGFGFDPIMDDYKIVGISYPKHEGPIQNAFVYSMRTNSWSVNSSPASLLSYVKVMSLACFVNGALHWVVRCELNNKDEYHYCILTFNLSIRVFRMIQLPQPSWSTMQLTIVEGSLAVISHKHQKTWIWVRRKFNNGEFWSKPFDLTSIGYEVGSDSKVTNHGDFMSKNYFEDFEGYNVESGVRSRLLAFLDSSYIIDMDMRGESLELLHNETS